MEPPLSFFDLVQVDTVCHTLICFLVLESSLLIYLRTCYVWLGDFAHCGQAVESDALGGGTFAWAFDDITVIIEISLCRVLRVSGTVISSKITAMFGRLLANIL